MQSKRLQRVGLFFRISANWTLNQPNVASRDLSNGDQSLTIFRTLSRDLSRYSRCGRDKEWDGS